MGFDRLALVAAIFLFSTAAHGQLTAPGNIVVGVAAVEIRVDKSDPRQDPGSSDYLAKAIPDLLTNYIQRGLEKGLDRRVMMISLPRPDPAAPPPNVELYPAVTNVGSLGLKVSVGLKTRLDSKAGIQATDLGEEVLLLPPTVNFGELDEKLTEFGVRIAKRLADPNTQTASNPNPKQPRGIVALYCIVPSDPADSQLARLARSLTIELPFQLTQAARKQSFDIFIRGLDLKEALFTCADPSGPSARIVGVSDSRIENFAWTGSLARDPKSKSRIALTIRSRDTSAGGNFRPIPSVFLDDGKESDFSAAAEKIIAEFAKMYERSQYKIFLHFETEAVRKSLEPKLTTTLAAYGYNVVGSDPPDSAISASWIDFFYPEDCKTAADIRRILLPTVSSGSVTTPFVRKQSSNRPATIGIWLSTKQISSPPDVSCQ